MKLCAFGSSLVLVALAAGCAPQIIGSAPSETPPSLVATPNGPVWDRPSAFGPVPETAEDVGAQVCGSLNNEAVTYVALGYHPLATDVDGEVLASGGFFCVPE